MRGSAQCRADPLIFFDAAEAENPILVRSLSRTTRVTFHRVLLECGIVDKQQKEEGYEKIYGIGPAGRFNPRRHAHCPIYRDQGQGCRATGRQDVALLCSAA